MPLDSFSFPQRGATSEDSWSDCGSDLTSEASSWVISQHPSRPPSHASTGVANLADLDDFEDTELHPRSSGAVDAASSGAADDGHSSVDNDNNSVASTVRCPLTLEAMLHPVYCMVDGRTYERAAIEAWVQSAGTSPLTRRPVALSQLRNVNESGGFDDDDDDVSITTQRGWPRARTADGHPAAPSQGNAGGAAAGPGDDKPSFLIALLAGGGGLESTNAKALTTARPYWNRRSSKHRASGNRQQENVPGCANATGAVSKRALHDTFNNDNVDISDWSQAEFEFQKGRGQRVRGFARVKGRLVVQSGRRHAGVGAAGGGASSGLLPARWSSQNMGLLLPIGESGMSDDEEEW